MTRQTSGGTAALLAVLLGALVVGACAAPRTPGPTAGPTPTLPPTSAPTSNPTGDAAFHVTLNQATSNLVSIDVRDLSATLVGALSGIPGDGASVEPYVLKVENLDPTTLRLTWVGGPCDSANSLSIDALGRRFVLVQAECNGDAVAFDRVLILKFATPVVAADVEAFLQDGLDS